MKPITYLFVFASLGGHSAMAATDIVDTTPANNQAGLSSQAGQTFTTPVLGADDALSTITVRGPQSGAQATVFTMKVWVDTDGDFETWDPGALVATSTNSLAIGSNNGDHVFTFSNEVLSSSTVYAFSFSNGGSDHVGFRPGLTNAGGVALTDGALFSGGAQPFGGAFDVSCVVTTVTSGNVRVWNGAVNTTWDVGVTSNWELIDSSPSTFAAGNDVIFDDTDPTGTVVLSGTIEPGSVTFDAASTIYSVSGDPLAGSGEVTVSQGDVIFLSDNTYSGGTVISSGVLTVGDGGTSGSLGSGAVANGDILEINLSGTPTIANEISGGGVLELVGSGAVTLSGASTFSGGTTIFGGGTVILGDAGGVGRNGTFGGQVTVVDGTFDTNGMSNYGNVGQAGAPQTWLTTANVVLGGATGATPMIVDSGGVPLGIAFAGGLTYDEFNDPGTATVAAQWTQSGTAFAGTRNVDVGDSAGTSVELDFTGGLGDVLALDGSGTTLRKLGAGTMRISSGNVFPGLQVSEGLLLVNHPDALGADRRDIGGSGGMLTVDGSGVLDLNGFSSSSGILSGNGEITGTITNGMAATTSTLTVGVGEETGAFGGVIEDGAGVVALTVAGGSQTLEGSQTYTGATTVTGGLLRVDSGATLATSGITVQGDGSIAGGSDAVIGSSTVSSLDLDGGGVSLRVAADTSSDTIVVSGVDAFAVNSTSVVTADVDAGAVLPFTTTILSYSGSIQGSLGFAGLATPQHGPYSLSDTGSAVELTVTSDPADTLVWIGNVSDDWEVYGDSNWELLSDSTSSSVYELDKVLFDDSLTGSGTVNLTADVTPESVEFNNTTATYTLEGGAITGGTDLVKNGTGTVTILSDSTYTGGTTVNAGKLAFGNGGTEGEIGQGPVTVLTGATLEINRSDFLDYKADDRLLEVIGGGDIVVTGGGTLWNYPGGGISFAGANTWDQFSGDLYVNGGSEFQTIRMGSTAMGTGSVVLGDGGSSGSLSQIEGSWTWTNDISLVGSDNKIINRSAGSNRSLKIQGVVSGSGGLTFEDPDTTMTNLGTGFILTGANTLSGTVVIPAPVPVRVGGVPGESTSVAVGDSGSLGTATVVNEGYLTFTRDNAHTVDATITGFGDLIVAGSDSQVMTLTGVNTYDGPTTVTDGTLIVNGTIGASDTLVESSGILQVNGTVGDGITPTIVAVDPGGTVGGNGTIEAVVSLSGALAPGASVGALASTSFFDFLPGSSYDWEITNWGGTTAGTDIDHLTSVDISFLNGPTPGDELTIRVLPSAVAGFSESGETYVIATATSSVSTFDASSIIIDDTAFAAATGALGTWAVQQNGLDIELVYTAGADPYLAYESANNILGAGADVDSDGDNIENGIEFVIGGVSDPGIAQDDSALLPTAATDATNLVYEYRRTDASAGDNPYVQYSGDLSTWNTAVGGVDGVVIAEDDDFYGAGIDKVTVTIPRSLIGADTGFARLRVDIP